MHSTAEQLASLKVGDAVAIARSGSYGPFYTFGHVVTHVTPTKRTITVEKQVVGVDHPLVSKFNANGNEITDSSTCRWIVCDVAAVHASIKSHQAMRDAAAKVHGVRVELQSHVDYSKENLLTKLAELDSMLAEARAAVQALEGN